MTAAPDLNAIRAALAAATPEPWADESELDEYGLTYHRITRGPEMSIEDDIAQVWSDNKADEEHAANALIVANAPVWLAQLISEVERLRAVEIWYFETCQKAVDLRYELAVARAEVERLRTLVTTYSSQLANFAAVNAKHNVDLDAWRACADQLADELRDANQTVDSQFLVSGEKTSNEESAALAVYETLKGADS